MRERCCRSTKLSSCAFWGIGLGLVDQRKRSPHVPIWWRWPSSFFREHIFWAGLAYFSPNQNAKNNVQLHFFNCSELSKIGPFPTNKQRGHEFCSIRLSGNPGMKTGISFLFGLVFPVFVLFIERYVRFTYLVTKRCAMFFRICR